MSAVSVEPADSSDVGVGTRTGDDDPVDDKFCLENGLEVEWVVS